MIDDTRHVSDRTAVGVSDPAATAVVSLVLGTLSLGGFGFLNGSLYVLPFTQNQAPFFGTVLAGLLGALFALAAAGLGLHATRRAHPDDPAWVSRIAQAGVLVAGIAVVLRLIATAVAAVAAADLGFFAPL